MKKIITKIYGCTRCKENSITNDSHGACPRGSCEGKIIGSKTTTITTTITLNKEINIKDYSEE